MGRCPHSPAPLPPMVWRGSRPQRAAHARLKGGHEAAGGLLDVGLASRRGVRGRGPGEGCNAAAQEAARQVRKGVSCGRR